MMAAPKTVLVTGCSKGGIGDGIAQSFHRRGFRVFATARSLTKIEHLKQMGLDVLILDIVDPASVKNAVRSITEATGSTLNYLVNNSGVGLNMPLLDVDIEKAKEVYETNVWGTLAVIQAFAAMLIACKGTIINIGSISGAIVVPWFGTYGSSKAAINMISENLRLEMKPFGVKVITIMGGRAQSNFGNNMLSHDTIPSNSFYNVSKTIVEENLHKAPAKNMTWSCEEFAEAVVRNAVKKTPNHTLWIGGGAFMAWLMVILVPHFIMDSIFSKMQGLHDVKKAWLTKEKKLGTRKLTTVL